MSNSLSLAIVSALRFPRLRPVRGRRGIVPGTVRNREALGLPSFAGGWSPRSRFDKGPGSSAKGDPFCAWNTNRSAACKSPPSKCFGSDVLFSSGCMLRSLAPSGAAGKVT